MIEYVDFSIKIEPLRGDVYPAIVLRSPAGEGRSTFSLPFDPDEIGDILFNLGESVRGRKGARLRDAAPGATRTRPQQIGDQLFSALFSGPASHLFHQSLGMIRERQHGLRIKLHIDPEEASLASLASLPWELMYRKETRDFLSLSRYTPILRYLDVQRPYDPLPLEPPLHILVAMSSPRDCQKLDLEKERGQIKRSWAKQEGVTVDLMEAATIVDLQDRLGDQVYHVLHYMGHGAFDSRTGQGVLMLEDEEGYAVPVDGGTLGVLLRDVPSLRLVFLNACETALVSKQMGLDPFAGVASAMVMAGIPAVVAMQFPISDAAAIRFASRFYPLLARGNPVDYAVAEGRRAIRLAEAETMEWATPVLFMRAPEGAIFEVSSGRRLEAPWSELPQTDEDLAQRLEELYTAGLSAFWLEEWEKAVRCFQAIVDAQPDHPDAGAKLEQARRQQKLHQLYKQAQIARAAGDWAQALSNLEALVAEAPEYQDAAALLELARRQSRLAELYAQARHLHQAGQWQAVTNVFAQIATLDPDYPDPDELLPTAERELAEQKRQAQLSDPYSRAVREMETGQWVEARRLLRQVQAQEPGYRETQRLLARAESEIERERQQQAQRQRREQTAGLYKEAQELAHAGQWQQALDKMGQIRGLDPQFPDPEGIDAQARMGLDREEEEARRQRELAALYADAVGLLRARRFQEALDKWDEVQAIDPAYPDGKKVQATARKKLAARDRPALWRRLPRGVWVAISVVALVAVMVAGAVGLWPIITATPSPTQTGGPPLPGPPPTNPVTGTVWEWSDDTVMVYVPADTFWMGSDESDRDAGDDEKPQHKVYLDAFWIDRSEVTNAMFVRFVADTGHETDAEKRGSSWTLNPSSREWEDLAGTDWQHPYGPSTSLDGLDKHPVVHVSWNDAAAYCQWADKRLPTEAEWEKAARGTDERIYPWGDTFDGSLLNFCDVNCELDWKDGDWDDGYANTAPVGSYRDGASPYGALDMAGNVWEWMADWYGEDYYSISPDRNPQGPDSGERRVLRGGSWYFGQGVARAACRSPGVPSSVGYLRGFRCARSGSEP